MLNSFSLLVALYN